LNIRFDANTNLPYVENITQNVVHDVVEILKLIKIAIANRLGTKTGLDAVCSRSHFLMTLMIEQEKHNGTKISSKLNFGDLAGMESVRSTKTKGRDKQLEGQKSVNLSLSQLTTVINDIVNSRKPTFRSSKLTYLLQDSLGGNTKTTVVVCASPHIFNREETIRSLTFAQSVKIVKYKAKINKEYPRTQLLKAVQKVTAEKEKFRTKSEMLERQIKLVLKSGKVSLKPEIEKIFRNLTE